MTQAAALRAAIDEAIAREPGPIALPVLCEMAEAIAPGVSIELTFPDGSSITFMSDGA